MKGMMDSSFHLKIPNHSCSLYKKGQTFLGHDASDPKINLYFRISYSVFQ